MPGAFSQYRDDETSDANSSEKTSASIEAPRGPESPEKQSATQIDEDVDALSSRFGTHLNGVPPVPPLLNAMAAEESSLGGDSPGPGEPGPLARGGLSAFPSLPAFHGILGRIPVPKPPEEQAAAVPPSSGFSFEASADKFKREFSSTHFAPPTSTVDSAQHPVAPPGGSVTATHDKGPPFVFKVPPGFQFTGQIEKYPNGVSWQGFGDQKPSFFSDVKTPDDSADIGTLPTGPDSLNEGLTGDQPTSLHGGQGQPSPEPNVQTSAKPEIPVGVDAKKNASQETCAAPGKRQSEHLQEDEESGDDEDTPAKRLFGQSRPTNWIMPEFPDGHTPKASTDLKPTKPTFSSSEDFISYAKKTMSMSKSGGEAITPDLKSLYEMIIAFTKYVASSTREDSVIKSAVANATRVGDALHLQTQLPNQSRDAVIEAWKKRTEIEGTLADYKTASHNSFVSLRSMERRVLERVVGYIQSVAEQAWNPNSPIEDSKRKVEETNTRMNDLRLEILTLEDKLQQTVSRANSAETGQDHLQCEMDRLENEHRSSEDKMRYDHRAELNDLRSKSGRDQKAALDELKAKYARQIESAEGKLRLHKQTTTRNDELEVTIRDLARDKYNLGLAKAAVEKEREELKSQVATLKMYEDGYKQIEKERDEFESSYNDIKAERDDLLQAPGALPDTASSSDSVANLSKVSHSNAGILNSYDEDLGVLEAYWDRQKQFAELAVRETAAELEQTEAQIAEITLQINDLQGIDQSESEEDDNFDEPEDDSDDKARPVAVHPSSGLLDTLAQPLTAEDSYPVLPAARPAFEPTQRQLQTYATKAAAPRASKPGVPGVGRAYVQTSNQGTGVTTAKEIRALESDGWTEVRPRGAK